MCWPLRHSPTSAIAYSHHPQWHFPSHATDAAPTCAPTPSRPAPPAPRVVELRLLSQLQQRRFQVLCYLTLCVAGHLYTVANTVVSGLDMLDLNFAMGDPSEAKDQGWALRFHPHSSPRPPHAASRSPMHTSHTVYCSVHKRTIPVLVALPHNTHLASTHNSAFYWNVWRRRRHARPLGMHAALHWIRRDPEVGLLHNNNQE